MIVVRLMGGTGNQMFQYASARALSLELNTALKLDLSYLEKVSLAENVDSRNYGLSVFNIKAVVLNDSELDRLLKKVQLNRKLKLGAINRRVFGNKLPLHKIFEETSRKYNKKFFGLSKNTWLVGYWQVPGYFDKYDAIIRKDFTFKDSPNRENLAIIDQMNEESASVAVHIRRGDFSKLDVLGVTPVSYYQRAIALIKEQVKEPSFYLFGDDMGWIRDNFTWLEKETKVVYVAINTEEKAHNNDIRLISSCKHQIIGNSTFAWWGAWLNPNEKKKVFAPLKIFNDPKINEQVQHMIPENWIRV